MSNDKLQDVIDKLKLSVFKAIRASMDEFYRYAEQDQGPAK